MTAATSDLTRSLGHELADSLRTGVVSSRDITLAHLDAAERENHALNAWRSLDRDGDGVPCESLCGGQ